MTRASFEAALSPTMRAAFEKARSPGGYKLSAIVSDRTESTVQAARAMKVARELVGIPLEQELLFLNMTMREYRAALLRSAWCGNHGGHRLAGCEICERLGE